MMAMVADDYKYYVLETNRARGDNIQRVQRRLERRKYNVELLRHRTCLRVGRPAGVRWRVFEADIFSTLDPHRGSVLLFSESTGRVYIGNNRGNRPGQLIRQ